jgi:hypothetical protein
MKDGHTDLESDKIHATELGLQCEMRYVHAQRWHAVEILTKKAEP